MSPNRLLVVAALSGTVTSVASAAAIKHIDFSTDDDRGSQPRCCPRLGSQGDAGL